MKAPEFDLFKFSDASAAQALRRAISALPAEQRPLVDLIARCAFTAGVAIGGAAIGDTVKASMQAPGHC